MKKILILGGGGFIGYNIANYLILKKNYQITLADIHFKKNSYSKFKIIEDDFSKPKAYEKLENNYDQVYMMAAIVGVNRTLLNPSEVIKVNTNLVNELINWIERSKIKKLLFASSSENYAGTTQLYKGTVPSRETIPLTISDIKHPRWTYAITKILGEAAFIHASKKFNFYTTIVRYQNAYGPEMGFKHVIPHLVQRFLSHNRRDPFMIYSANQTRSFCYISDAVEGTIKAMNSKNSNGEIYHIGNDQEISIKMLTKEVGKLMGYIGKYKDGPIYPESVNRRCPDISKCKKDLFYRPKVDWKKGVKETVEWYKKYFNSRPKTTVSDFIPPEKLL